MVLVLLVLVGRGLGWFGHEAQPGPVSTTALASEPRSAPPTAVLAVAPDATIEPPAPAPAPAAPPDEVPAAQAVPLGETSPPGNQPLASAAATDAPASTSPAVDRDHFASHLSVLTAHIAAGELGEAIAALRALGRLPLDEAQRTAAAVHGAELESALAKSCASIVQSVLASQVLTARDDIWRLLGLGNGLADPWLDSALQAAGRRPGLDRARATAESTQPMPIPRPLARGREVRLRRSGRLVTGVVVDSRSDQVTVRLVSSTGIAFPTVPVVAIEPVTATADEAIEMAFAALQAEDVVLARLWFGEAESRNAGAWSERGRRLLTLLE